MRMRWVGYMAYMEMKNVYKILFSKLMGRDHSRRPMCRWEDFMEMELREIGREGVNWMHMAQDRDWWHALVNMQMILQVP
jgi:hypothetical protein